MLFARTRTNPVFHADRLRLLLGDERAQRAATDPASVDLLTWNVFASLETHSDPNWLAYLLRRLVGDDVTGPVRLSLWTGAEREPLLRPSSGFLTSARQRVNARGVATATDTHLPGLSAPIEVPVRIESAGVLGLVDTTLTATPPGRFGRDRVVELIDAGIDHARRLDTTLAVAFVYAAGSSAAQILSERLRALSAPGALGDALPHRPNLPPPVLRGVTWQEWLRVWRAELDYLDLAGQPVRRFLDYCARLGLV